MAKFLLSWTEQHSQSRWNQKITYHSTQNMQFVPQAVAV